MLSISTFTDKFRSRCPQPLTRHLGTHLLAQRAAPITNLYQFTAMNINIVINLPAEGCYAHTSGNTPQNDTPRCLAHNSLTINVSLAGNHQVGIGNQPIEVNLVEDDINPSAQSPAHSNQGGAHPAGCSGSSSLGDSGAQQCAIADHPALDTLDGGGICPLLRGEHSRCSALPTQGIVNITCPDNLDARYKPQYFININLGNALQIGSPTGLKDNPASVAEACSHGSEQSATAITGGTSPQADNDASRATLNGASYCLPDSACAQHQRIAPLLGGDGESYNLRCLNHHRIRGTDGCCDAIASIGDAHHGDLGIRNCVIYPRANSPPDFL